MDEPIHVLLIEDNPADARLVQEALRDSKAIQFRIEHVSRLSDAKRALAAGLRADVIALDLSLPDTSGLDTVRKVQALAPGVPIVVLTGLEDESVGLEAVRCGVQDYLVKGELLGGAPARALRYAVERRRAETEMLRAKEAAEAANRAKDAFLANLSHELRTPLTPVLLIVSMIESDPALPSHFRGDLKTVREHVETEARLINDLLDLTKVARGKLELVLEDVDVHELLASVVATANLRVPVPAASLDLRAARRQVRCDRGRLRQVFSNLVENAQKFTRADGSIVVRTLDDASSSDRIRIEVRDTGIGINPEVLPRLFTPFEQGDVRAWRQHAGLGLGLAISKSLVEAHHGTIRAESAGKGQGTKLTVVLPSARPAAAASVSATRPPATSAGRRLRVLLVEDHEPTLEVLAKLLTAAGHTVTSAASFAAADALAHGEDFDLLLSDLALPDGNGLDLMRRLRDRYAGRSIALTGFGTAEDIRSSRDAGFAAHLTKPIDSSELLSTIQQIARGAA